MARAFAEPRFLKSFGFGLSQALASTIFAVAVGMPAAFLLARRSFPGKRLLGALSAVPFCVPPLIMAIGFVLFYGRQGYLSRFLQTVTGTVESPVTFLYSFWGIVLIHGLYNFPLVMRMAADAWSRVPANQEDAAKLMGAGKVRIFFTVTLPSIAPSVGAAASLTFLLCFFSFVIVLMFAPPGTATPEVELYRAARFDFDQSLASAFALAETGVAMLVLALYALFEKLSGPAVNEAAPRFKPLKIRGARGKILLAAYGIMICVFLAGPLVSVVIESFLVKTRGAPAAVPGFGNFARLFSAHEFRAAAVNTVLIGVASALLASAAGFIFSIRAKTVSSRAEASIFYARIIPMLPLAVSGIVLAYGWTRLIGSSSFLVIAAVQAVSTYPFVMRGIQGALGNADEKYADAARTLGSSSLGVILRVRLPLALPSLLSGFAFAFAISAGDANAIIIAPVPGMDTMAGYLYRLAGSYRFNEACAVAVVLGVLSASMFFMKDIRDAVT